MTLLRLFFFSTGRFLRLAVGGFRSGGAGGRPGDPWGGVRRTLLLIAFLPLLALVLLIHWLGFLLDEVFFRGYRKVEIAEPLFVLGVPRSGTTHLHRVLAQDERLTTFSTWECLFALSVTARRFWMGLGRLDARLGSPLGRLLERVERHAFGALADVHSMGLKAPEEDYFSLVPVLACFILVLPFPADPFLWRMGAFDRDMPAPERKRLMAFYRGCLQRHLYVHGTHKRLLSKNAAFAPLAGSLRETFPDARFLVCLREPERTLPSQLSSLEAGLRLFAVQRVAPQFGDRLARQLVFYYKNLACRLGDMPEDRCAWVTMADLSSDLHGTVAAVYGRLKLPLDDRFDERLRSAAEEARGYRSRHRYSPERLGLAPDALDADLAGLYATLAARSARFNPAGADTRLALEGPPADIPSTAPSGAPLPC